MEEHENLAPDDVAQLIHRISADDQVIESMSDGELEEAFAVFGLREIACIECIAKLIDEARNRGKIDIADRFSPDRALDLFYGRTPR